MQNTEYLAFLIAQRQTSELARSALPEAPYLPPLEPRAGVRQRLAGTLRRVADVLEPADRSAHRSSPATGMM